MNYICNEKKIKAISFVGGNAVRISCKMCTFTFLR